MENLQLESLERKISLIRDRVRGVAEGRTTGIYLHGRGGTSKSYTVETTLRSLRKPYKVSNSAMSAAGLFDTLRDAPDMIHVLDDMESILSAVAAHGVLRSALWAVPNKDGRCDRLVTWKNRNKQDEFIFSGGIIMIANRPLPDRDTLQALKTRIVVLEHTVTNEEVLALMRKMADGGVCFRGQHLSKEACHEVVDAIRDGAEMLRRPMDIRLFVNGVADRLQSEAGSENDWRTLLESRIKERTIDPRA